MKRWKRWATVVAVPALSIIGIGLPASVAGATTYAITGFTPSQTSLTSAGGLITFTGTLPFTGSCTLSSKPAMTGLPKTSVNCSPLPSVVVPANTKKVAITYKVTLTITDVWDSAVTAKATATITETPAPGGTYVALGDSYSAGFGNPAPPFLTLSGMPEPSGTTDDGCNRTSTAYPVALAKVLKGSKAPISAPNLSFLACTGATSTDVWSGSPAVANGLAGASGDNGEATQLNDTGDLANAKVVTLSIGGNDINFGSVIIDCLADVANCNANSFITSAVAHLETNITNLKSVLVATYQQIEAKAPNAAIYVMGYPDIVPPQPSPLQRSAGCGPFAVAGAAQGDPLGAGAAVQYLATAENNLNAVISGAASLAGVHYVDPNDPNPKNKGISFLNHSACDTDRWFNQLAGGLIPLFHPTVPGQDALFKSFKAAITAHPSVSPSFAPLTGVKKVVSNGGASTCALLTSGGIDCWGENGFGSLGNGTTVDAPAAVPVVGISNAVQIDSSEFDDGFCAILETGAVDCWGWRNQNYQTIPVQVPDVAGAVSVTTGQSYACALLSSGSIDCWGANASGQLGNGQLSVPGYSCGAGPDGCGTSLVVGISNATSVASAGSMTCAILSDGSVDCWGFNASGQLGNGTIGGPDYATNGGPGCAGICYDTPQRVTGVENAKSISTHNGPTCVLMTTGSVSCWGDTFYGQLGNGTQTGSATPVPVSGVGGVGVLSGVSALTPIDGPYCALLQTGSIDCWGLNAGGSLGTGEAGGPENCWDGIGCSTTPVPILGTSDTVGFARAGQCALRANGGVDCWGDGYNPPAGGGAGCGGLCTVGAVGIDGLANIASATEDIGGILFAVTTLTAGGTVYSVGDNAVGQLGNGHLRGGPGDGPLHGTAPGLVVTYANT